MSGKKRGCDRGLKPREIRRGRFGAQNRSGQERGPGPPRRRWHGAQLGLGPRTIGRAELIEFSNEYEINKHERAFSLSAPEQIHDQAARPLLPHPRHRVPADRLMTRLSSRHTLAITRRGGGAAAALVRRNRLLYREFLNAAQSSPTSLPLAPLSRINRSGR